MYNICVSQYQIGSRWVVCGRVGGCSESADSVLSIVDKSKVWSPILLNSERFFSLLGGVLLMVLSYLQGGHL